MNKNGKECILYNCVEAYDCREICASSNAGLIETCVIIVSH